jgi:hypothetical protein
MQHQLLLGAQLFLSMVRGVEESAMQFLVAHLLLKAHLMYLLEVKNGFY